MFGRESRQGGIPSHTSARRTLAQRASAPTAEGKRREQEMQMKESEILRYMHRHHKNLRAGMCGGKPSEVAQRSWKLYDAH